MKRKEVENTILNGDSLSELKIFPNESINCVMTSPPYWALRDYGSSVETIWDAKEGCEHEWEESITKINRMIGMNERLQIEKGNRDSKFVQEWDRPSRREFSNRTIANICPVCKKEFEAKPNQKFCSLDCLNTLSNKERQMIENKSNFCQKCNAWKGQLGLESTFDLYIKHLCDIFDEVKRVLRKDGTCWVNMGDTYYSISGGKFMNDNIGSKDRNELKGLAQANELKSGDELEQKNLCNIPARFSIEMQNRGWILRNVIIWHKPNCMPSSVKDRFTVDFEYLFFFVKNKKYFFETQYEERITKPIKDLERIRNQQKGNNKHNQGGVMSFKNTLSDEEILQQAFQGRNKRAVWTITTKPFKEAHFAVYPEELCWIPIKAGCSEFVCNKCGKAREKIIEPTEEYSKFLGKGWHDHQYDNKMGMGQQTRGFSSRKGNVEGIERYKIKGYTSCSCNAGFSGGIILDPFFGAGTTGLVALKQNKKFIGIELNKKYIEIATKRLKPFLEQTKLDDLDNQNTF